MGDTNGYEWGIILRRKTPVGAGGLLPGSLHEVPVPVPDHVPLGSSAPVPDPVPLPLPKLGGWEVALAFGHAWCGRYCGMNIVSARNGKDNWKSVDCTKSKHTSVQDMMCGAYCHEVSDEEMSEIDVEDLDNGTPGFCRGNP